MSFIWLLVWALTASAQESPRPCTMALKIEGTIGPGTVDYFDRGAARADKSKCGSILLEINTPGGSLTSTRLLVEKFLASSKPILCLISPEGGHAGSAGAYLMMACHVNGALPATNIGAGTPIGPGGDLEKDLRKKVVQDNASWLVGLARLRGRNVEFAEKLVTEAKAIDADEAARVRAIDTVAMDRARFLDFAEGREVTLTAQTRAQVHTGALVIFEPDLRARFLQFITDPQFAYLLFMASLALLYFEITHAGMVLPGVAGGIGLMISLISFHLLEVRWGAAGLIALGVAFMIAEAFVTSFGALGIGGLVAFAAGSFLLYEPGPAGEALLPMSIITLTVIVAGGIMMGLAVLAFRTRRLGGTLAQQGLIGASGEVASFETPSLRRGMIIVNGEYWRFHASRDLALGENVRVVAREELELKVE